jgi:hypothetical protein
MIILVCSCQRSNEGASPRTLRAKVQPFGFDFLALPSGFALCVDRIAKNALVRFKRFVAAVAFKDDVAVYACVRHQFGFSLLSAIV